MEEMAHQPAAIGSPELLMPPMIQALRIIFLALHDDEFESEIAIERSRRLHSQKNKNGPSPGRPAAAAAAPQNRNMPTKKKRAPPPASTINNKKTTSPSRKRKKNDTVNNDSLPSVSCVDEIGGINNARSAAAAPAAPQRSPLEPTLPKDDSMTPRTLTTTAVANTLDSNSNSNADILGDKKQTPSSTSNNATVPPSVVARTHDSQPPLKTTQNVAASSNAVLALPVSRQGGGPAIPNLLLAHDAMMAPSRAAICPFPTMTMTATTNPFILPRQFLPSHIPLFIPNYMDPNQKPRRRCRRKNVRIPNTSKPFSQLTEQDVDMLTRSEMHFYTTQVGKGKPRNKQEGKRKLMQAIQERQESNSSNNNNGEANPTPLSSLPLVAAGTGISAAEASAPRH